MPKGTLRSKGRDSLVARAALRCPFGYVTRYTEPERKALGIASRGHAAEPWEGGAPRGRRVMEKGGV